MSGPLRPCGRPGCRLCHPIQAPEEPSTLARDFLGFAALVVIFAVLVFVLMPVLG